MRDIAMYLIDVKVFILNPFLIDLVLTSLLSEYDLLMISCNTHNKNRIVIELLTE